MTLKQLGTVQETERGFAVQLNEEFREGLENIEGFSLLNILWWADRTDEMGGGESLVTEKPYVKGPDRLGIFATRSPFRPNPLCVTVIGVTGIDRKNGLIHTAYIDALPGTPVVDIKPYQPSTDRAETVEVPAWCGHWPKSIEASGAFDWAAEFNFPQ